MSLFKTELSHEITDIDDLNFARMTCRFALTCVGVSEKGSEHPRPRTPEEQKRLEQIAKRLEVKL